MLTENDYMVVDYGDVLYGEAGGFRCVFRLLKALLPADPATSLVCTGSKQFDVEAKVLQA